MPSQDKFFIAIGTLSVFYTFWVLWNMAASVDHMVSVRQMQSKGPGFQKGIPLQGHWAMMYADIILPLLIAYLVAKYGQQWSLQQIGLMIGAGFALSFIMHLTYIEAGKHFPEAPTYGGRLTTAGWLHFVYMGLAFAAIGLLYLCTSKPTPFDIWLTTIWLVIHVVVGVHVPLKLLKPDWFPYHGIMDAGTLAPIFASAAILLGMTWWTLR